MDVVQATLVAKRLSTDFIGLPEHTWVAEFEIFSQLIPRSVLVEGR